MKPQIRALAACLVFSAAPTTALAQPSKDAAATAQRLFDEALASMKAGKYADACPRLAESQRLDPGMGTKFRLAECYEGAGLVGSAFSLFNEVAADAVKAGRADREKQAKERASTLKPRVPWMTIAVPLAIAGIEGLEVKRDGELVARGEFDRRVPVDPGAHTITATAPKKKPWQTVVRALEGGVIEVKLSALEDEGDKPSPAPPAPVAAPAQAPPRAPPPPPAAPPPAAPEASPGGGQRIAGIVVGSAGLAGVAVGAALGVVAKSSWDRALGGCQNGDKTRCPEAAIADGNSAKGLATGSTVGFVAGGALVATGLVVLLTAPSKKASSAGVRLVPVVGPGVASALVEGRFR